MTGRDVGRGESPAEISRRKTCHFFQRERKFYVSSVSGGGTRIAYARAGCPLSDPLHAQHSHILQKFRRSPLSGEIFTSTLVITRSIIAPFKLHRGIWATFAFKWWITSLLHFQAGAVYVMMFRSMSLLNLISIEIHVFQENRFRLFILILYKFSITYVLIVLRYLMRLIRS